MVSIEWEGWKTDWNGLKRMKEEEEEMPTDNCLDINGSREIGKQLKESKEFSLFIILK